LFWVVKENLFSFHITGDFKMFESKISLPILNLVGYIYNQTIKKIVYYQHKDRKKY